MASLSFRCRRISLRKHQTQLIAQHPALQTLRLMVRACLLQRLRQASKCRLNEPALLPLGHQLRTPQILVRRPQPVQRMALFRRLMALHDQGSAVSKMIKDACLQGGKDERTIWEGHIMSTITLDLLHGRVRLPTIMPASKETR